MVNGPTSSSIVKAVLLGSCLFLDQALASESWQCKAQPTEPCFKHHGRLSSQNGIALAIWLTGTARRVGVYETDVPSFLYKWLDLTLPNHSYIYGDFTICPLEADIPGHLRRVCVAGAERLVVQNLADPKRVFRLLSTWPATER
jgi:hypothetical protein